MAERRPSAIGVLDLEKNGGKAEAVRRGLVAALEGGAQIVGYLDADLATPSAEMRRLLRLFNGLEADVLLASRVALLGRDIQRRASRHYLGRVFATAAALVLHERVYDTQCGAKLFRRTPALERALAEPFLSRWVFDVELIGRLLAGARGVPAIERSRIVEEPLMVWRDVPGSKIRPRHFVIALADLIRISGDLSKRRNGRAG
jgi:glycosyltransferase involved in cell wall biosynthesis